MASMVPLLVTKLPYGDCDACVATATVAGAALGPQSIKCDEEGLIYLLDSLHRRLLVYTSEGKALSPISLPAPGDDFCVLGDGTIWEMDLTQRSFYHLCPDGTVIKKIDQPSLPASLRRLYHGPDGSILVQASDQDSYPLTSLEEGSPLPPTPIARGMVRHDLASIYVRAGKAEMGAGIVLFNSSSSAQPDELRIRFPGKAVVAIQYLGRDLAGNQYIYLETATSSEMPIGENIERHLLVLDSGGDPLSTAEIPLSLFYSQSSLAVCPDGGVYQLLTRKNHGFLLKWSLAAQSSETKAVETLPADWFGTLLEMVRPLASEGKAANEAESAGTETFPEIIPSLSVSRNTMIANALGYANHWFTASAANLTTGYPCSTKTVITPSWLVVGQNQGVPYKWGGFSGLDGYSSGVDCGVNFDEGLSAGKFAGDDNCVGSSGDCCAVGVDCSGFVSQMWGVSHTNVSGLISQSCPLSYSGQGSNVLPGDIWARTGSDGHVMMVEMTNADGSIKVIESSAYSPAWRVGETSFTPSWLVSQGYSPYRYRLVNEPFSAGQRMQADSSGVNVRSCAGTGCPSNGTLSAGDLGTIVGGPQTVDGYVWWQVNWDRGLNGWSAQCYLDPSIQPPSCTLSCAASASPSSGTAPLTVNFTASATPSGCSGTPSFSWTFGDGGTSTAQNPSHAYAAAGSYTWTMTTSLNGATCNKSGGVTVLPPSCPTIAVGPSVIPNGTAGVFYSQNLYGSGGTAPYSFAVTSGSLPNGISLSSGGVLSGTPSSSGTYNFIITATDANRCTGSQPYTFTINPPSCPTIAVGPSVIPNGTAGVFYSQNLYGSGGTAPYSFAVTSGFLPNGISLSSGGVLSGTPSSSGTYNFIITATDANRCTGSQGYTFTVVSGGTSSSWAVITNVQDDTIQTIDLSSGTVYGPFLAGQLGSGQELLDAATTPDGHYALLSNWEAQRIFIVDLSRPTSPSLAASVSLPFPPEDVAVAPNGQFAVATDGGTSNQIAAIDLNSRSLAGVYSLRTSGAEAVSVAIAADNQTVVVTDAKNNQIIFGQYNPYTGFLGEGVLPTGSDPINVAIAPDGRTVLVANAWGNSISAYAVTALGQLSPGTVVTGVSVAPQSIVFSSDGAKAYVLSDSTPQEELSWLNVMGSGSVSLGASGIATLLPTAGKVYYGIDGMALSPDGRTLVCTNAASGTQSAVDLIDTSSVAVRTISTGGQYPVGVACFGSGGACTAPAITVQPQDQTVSSGQAATLSVTASGAGPLSFQWYQGQSGDVSHPVGGATGSSFTTPTLTATTQYWVRVSNSCGHIDSASATITVLTTPPPSIASLTKLGSPFRIVAAGGNIQSGMKVYINGSLWANTSWKSTAKLVLKGSASLKSAVPPNTPTQFTFVNPDGGSVTKTWQWP